MIWIICAVVCALMMALSLNASLQKDKGSMRIIPVLVCLFIAAYVIYIPIFLKLFDPLSALIGNFIHMLQVVTIDADFLEYNNIVIAEVGNPVFVKLYMVLMGTIHLVLPTTSAVTAVTVLFRCFSTIQLFFANRKRRPLYVFSELNERSLQFAQSLKGVKCDIVFANCNEDSLNNGNEVSRSYIFKEEPISDLKFKITGKKEIHLFCISDNEDESLTCSLELIERLSKIKESAQEHVHIYQFSKYEDFTVYIDSADEGALDVKCINEFETHIYKLFDEHPLFKYADGKIHLLLHGLSPINQVALKTAVWCGQLCGYDMKISVAGVNLKPQIDGLKISAPGIFSSRYDVNFYDCDSEKEVVDAIANHCADANYIIVSEENDNKTMDSGLLLRRLFYKLDPEYKYCPPIFCYVKEPAKFNIVKNLTTAETNPDRKMSYALTPFGSLDKVYTHKEFVDSDLEKIAKNVHLAYEDIFSDGPIDVKDALKRYNVFEVNKRSNRAAALHIRYKLNLIGLDYVDDADAQSVKMGDYFTEEHLEQLAVSEHDRWMAFLEAEGWTTSEKSDVEAYRASGISKGRHNCPLLKMHPYICEYDKLRELSTEIEGKDTTVYDKELILRIPDILGDKWKVSGKRFAIVPLNKDK